VAYLHDDEARQCAVEYAISLDQVADLRARCEKRFSELGANGVRSHGVRFSAEPWGDLPGLPDQVSQSGCVSRGDIFDLADQVPGKYRATDLLKACFVWGWGPAGYGPRRFESICRAAGEELEPALRRALAATTDGAGVYDPIAGYSQFYGGDDRRRAWPGQAPWSRLRGLGPAFFTKFLYFSTPGVLILDNRLANAVHYLCAMPSLVTKHGRSVVWTPFRYAVYLHWMRQTAQALNVDPPLLELTLFSRPDRPIQRC
jgi:hypothetical protein